MKRKLSSSSQGNKRQAIMDDKDRTNCAELEEMEKFVYDFGTDGSCDFEDGQSIPVNRGALAFNCAFFRNAFFGPEPTTHFKVKGFDRAMFKMFLDCLLGLKEYTLLDAILIYPIAQRYEVKESLKKCVAALEPKVMNENVSLVLNLSAFYGNDELTDYVINFIKMEYGVVNFLENAEYSSCLEPLAMRKLIENADLNSLMWTLVYQWGERYLKERDNSDVKTFFMENKILEKISLSHFESVKTLINFYKLSKMELLCHNQILNVLEKNVSKGLKKLPDQSEWIKIDPGYSFKETIVLKNIFRVYKDLKEQNLDFVVWPNQILFDLDDFISTGLNPGYRIKARYLFRHIQTCQTISEPKPIWRGDLQVFYREKSLVSPRKDYFISAISPSDEFDLNLVAKSKSPVFKFSSNFWKKTWEIHSVEITYNFNLSCRILKASLDPSVYSVSEKNLHFTKNVIIGKEYHTEDYETEDEDEDDGDKDESHEDEGEEEEDEEKDKDEAKK